MKTINNDLIRSFGPCYDPSEKKIPDGETLSVLDWVEKYRSVVPPQDIIWLLCLNESLSDRDLRLFAVWCAREALSLIDSPDPRSVAACDVAERFANGEASQEEIIASYADATRAPYGAAYAAARASACAANRSTAFAAFAAAHAAAEAAAHAAPRAAARASACAAREKQLVKLLTYLK